MSIFPWQLDQWQHITDLKQKNRLPHALLLVGLEGTGKIKFAQALASALLCQLPGPTGFACGTCHACRLIEGKTHPNLLIVKPQDKSHIIKVDQIRELNEFLQQSALNGEYTIVIIHPAQVMNINAANALLKTLEEPANNSLLILVTPHSENLPRTIISRCQRLAFPKPKTEQALKWLRQELNDSGVDAELLLRLAHGAPLTAQQTAEDNFLPLRQEIYQTLPKLLGKPQSILHYAQSLQAHSPLQVIDLILSWVLDLLRLHLGASSMDIVNRDYAESLLALGKMTYLTPTTYYLDYLIALRKQLNTQIALNKQLVIESALLKWMECTK